jgi:hypothetical protein
MQKCADLQFVEKTAILERLRFRHDRDPLRELGVNIMVGSSDGRRASHRLDIELVRCAFPVQTGWADSA